MNEERMKVLESESDSDEQIAELLGELGTSNIEQIPDATVIIGRESVDKLLERMPPAQR